MERQLYVSCIKINGVPILPPLLTENIRSEMNYYKQLAIAVEEKLKILQMAKQAETAKCMENIAKECVTSYDGEITKRDSCDSASQGSCNAETESITINTVPNIENDIEVPTKEDNENVQDFKLGSVNTSVSESLTDPTVQPFESNANSKNHYHDKEVSVRRVSSNMVTVSTDLNQYLDTIPSTQPTIADTTPEILKPQVPKTLDIIPITMDGPPLVEGSQPVDNQQSSGDTPKLVRQGSYILETPSPLLLAHMQTELTDSNYIPTPTTNAMKRKEWNISQAKTEWENQIRNKEFIIPDSSRSITSHPKSRRNSMSTVINQKICKSVLHTNTGSQLGMYQPARSVDCIQTMLAKEIVRKSPNNKMNKYSQRHNSNMSSSVNGHGSPKCKTNRNVSIQNLANKLGGSLGSLTIIGTPTCRHVEKKQCKTTLIVGSLDSKSTRDTAIPKSSSPLKSVLMSEKLLTIFKEIQETHDKQMSELMDRQRKEQINMQTEFEKQQTLLLSRIKKTFPEISTPLLCETISTTTTSGDVTRQADNFHRPLTAKKQDELHCPDNSNLLAMKCPLDYIYPLNGDQTTSSQSTQTSEDESFSMNIDSIGSKDEPIQRFSTDDHANNSRRAVSPTHRNLNVSRQLFPSDSKTLLVPVPDNTIYGIKHIHAATIINAYARGYLVRRMMKTERVIALENTYREALHCMLKLHIDAPLNLSEFNFHQRLQLQTDRGATTHRKCCSHRMLLPLHTHVLHSHSSPQVIQAS